MVVWCVHCKKQYLVLVLPVFSIQILWFSMTLKNNRIHVLHTSLPSPVFMRFGLRSEDPKFEFRCTHPRTTCKSSDHRLLAKHHNQHFQCFKLLNVINSHWAFWSCLVIQHWFYCKFRRDVFSTVAPIRNSLGRVYIRSCYFWFTVMFLVFCTLSVAKFTYDHLIAFYKLIWLLTYEIILHQNLNWKWLTVLIMMQCKILKYILVNVGMDVKRSVRK